MAFYPRLHQFVINHRLAILIAAIAVGAASALALWTNVFDSQPPTQLRILVWPGYAPPTVIGSFEAQCGCEVVVKYMVNSDDLKSRLTHAQNPDNDFDVISPSSDIAPWLKEQGLVLPLNRNEIPAFKSLTDSMKPELEQVQTSSWFDRHIRKRPTDYGIPFMWGANVLLYNPSFFSTAPTSWNVLFDEKYGHRIALWDDISTVYMTAQYMTAEHRWTGQSDVQLYSLTPTQLDAVRKQLAPLKGKVYLWSDPSELKRMFRERKVVVALGWPLTANQLKAEHIVIQQAIPDETTGWIDYLMIPRASSHPQLAQQLVNYLMETKSQVIVADTTGYVPATKNAVESMSAREGAAADQRTAEFPKIKFWCEVPRRDSYNDVLRSIR